MNDQAACWTTAARSSALHPARFRRFFRRMVGLACERVGCQVLDDGHVRRPMPGAQAREVVVEHQAEAIAGRKADHSTPWKGGFAGVAAVREQPAHIMADMVHAGFNPAVLAIDGLVHSDGHTGGAAPQQRGRRGCVQSLYPLCKCMQMAGRFCLNAKT